MSAQILDLMPKLAQKKIREDAQKKLQGFLDALNAELILPVGEDYTIDNLEVSFDIDLSE